MKNKKVTYGLLLVVVGIWGVLGFKFVNAVGGSEFYDIPSTSSTNYNGEVFAQNEFQLRDKYRDPFFGKVVGAKKTTKKKVATKKTPVKKVEEPPFDWSFVKYTGEFENRSDKSKTALVQMWGNDRLMHEGEVFDGLKLEEITKDSIHVSFDGKKKYIRR